PGYVQCRKLAAKDYGRPEQHEQWCGAALERKDDREIPPAIGGDEEREVHALERSRGGDVWRDRPRDGPGRSHDRREEQYREPEDDGGAGLDILGPAHEDVPAGVEEGRREGERQCLSRHWPLRGT